MLFRKTVCVAGVAVAALCMSGCGDSGGSSATQTVTQTTTVTSVQDPQQSKTAPSGIVVEDCGQGVGTGTSVTSCPFALNVGQEYRSHQPPLSTIVAYSPVTQREYTMACRKSTVEDRGDQREVVDCRGGKDAIVVLF